MKQISIRKTIGIFLAAVLFLSVVGVSFATGDYYNESDQENETLAEQREDEIKQADIQLNFVRGPTYIEEYENLYIRYEIENYGDQTGNESFVDLFVNGTLEDTQYDIELDPGETHQGTLTYTDVDANYETDEMINWTVRLWDYGDTMSDQTQVGVPYIDVTSASAPQWIEETENLTVDYELKNFGTGTGEESFVDLIVNGSIVNSETNVELSPDETHQGTLTYTNVDANYDEGDTISWMINLWDFNGNMTGETHIQILPAEVDYIEMKPDSDQVITAGDTIDFDAAAYQEYQNLPDHMLDDKDMNFTWQNTNDMGIFYKTTAGEYVVNASYNGVSSAESTVTVEPAAVDYIEVSPSDNQTIATGETIDFSAEAYDQYDNLLTDDDTDFTWNNTDNTGLFKKTQTGEYEVKVTYQGMTSEPTSVTVKEPAYFEVEITNYDDEVQTGDTVTVKIKVTNTGGIEDTQRINFTVDGEQIHTVQMTIGENDVKESELTWEPDEAGDYNLRVESEDSSTSVSVTVQESDGIPGFTTMLLILGTVTAVAIYYKRKHNSK